MAGRREILPTRFFSRVIFMWWRFLLLFIVLPLGYAAWICAPYAGIRKKSGLRMIREAGLKEGEVAYDLGAGTGRFILLAERYFGWNVRGVEFVPFVWLCGILQLLFFRVPVSRLRLGNLYTMSFADIDVFFCFLMPKAMARLGPKFRAEAKKGARIFSYAFLIPGWEPVRVVHEDGEASIFCYVV